jgi:hypothetical protein
LDETVDVGFLSFVMARPTLYHKNLPGAARFICQTWGADRECLAKALGISLATLYDWEREHPEFLEAVRQGSAEHDDRVVVGALLRLARGFRMTRRTWDAKNRDFVDIEVDVPPDVRAIALWMANRHGWHVSGSPKQLGAGPAGEAGRQELVDDPRVGQLANDVLEARHGTKIRVESQTVDRSPETVVTESDAKVKDG